MDLYSLGLQVVEVPSVLWEDIGGLESVKRDLREVCSLSNLKLLYVCC